MNKPVLDATDHALINLLREDARTPTAVLARKLKLSRTTVQSRMERLQRQRVIAGYTISVPDELEASLVRAHVLITLAARPNAPGSGRAIRRPAMHGRRHPSWPCRRITGSTPA